MTYPYPPFAAIEHALSEVILAARPKGIRLQDVKPLTAPGEEHTLQVWFFYKHDTDVPAYEQDGTSEWLTERFVEELSAAKKQFRFTELPETTFMFDSTENLKKNYQGNYYLRFK